MILRALPLCSPYPHFCCGTKPGLLTGAQGRLTGGPNGDHISPVPPGPLLPKTAFPPLPSGPQGLRAGQVESELGPSPLIPSAFASLLFTDPLDICSVI